MAEDYGDSRQNWRDWAKMLARRWTQPARPVGECDGRLATTLPTATLFPSPLKAAKGKGWVRRLQLAFHRIHHAGKLRGVLRVDPSNCIILFAVGWPHRNAITLKRGFTAQCATGKRPARAGPVCPALADCACQCHTTRFPREPSILQSRFPPNLRNRQCPASKSPIDQRQS